MRFIITSFILLSMLFLATTTINAQPTAITNQAPTTEVAPTAKTIKVKVKGVGCSRDIQAISMNVAKVEGVSICETLKKGATTTFSVTYNPAVAQEKAIYSAVEDTPGCSNQTARPYKVKL